MTTESVAIVLVDSISFGPVRDVPVTQARYLFTNLGGGGWFTTDKIWPAFLAAVFAGCKSCWPSCSRLWVLFPDTSRTNSEPELEK